MAEERTGRSALRVMALGHSHIAALINGYRQARGEIAANVTFIVLNRPEYRQTPTDKNLNPRISEAISTAQPDAIFACIGGNAHNVLGLLNHPAPFDFVLPERPDLPLNPAAETLPSGVVEAWFRERMERINFPLMRALAAEAGRPIVHLEPPPPLPDTEHLRNTAEPMFQERLAELGVAPAPFRYKLWRLQSALLREVCAETGADFLPVPPEAQDADGLLREAYWGKDATHGNALFGAEMLKAALRVAAARISQIA